MTQMGIVSCKYGASMGRHNYGHIEDCAPRTVRLFHVRLDSGGYDDGGAYWGNGEPIYCATDDADYFATIRASNRTHAALLLDIDTKQLRAKLRGLAWLRYSVRGAMIGKASPVLEISEFGKPVGYVESWEALCNFAQSGKFTRYEAANA